MIEINMLNTDLKNSEIVSGWYGYKFYIDNFKMLNNSSYWILVTAIYLLSEGKSDKTLVGMVQERTLPSGLWEWRATYYTLKPASDCSNFRRWTGTPGKLADDLIRNTESELEEAFKQAFGKDNDND